MPMLVLRTRKVMMTNQRVCLSVLAALTKRFESSLVADSLYIEAQKKPPNAKKCLAVFYRDEF